MEGGPDNLIKSIDNLVLLARTDYNYDYYTHSKIENPNLLAQKILLTHSIPNYFFDFLLSKKMIIPIGSTQFHIQKGYMTLIITYLFYVHKKSNLRSKELYAMYHSVFPNFTCNHDLEYDKNKSNNKDYIRKHIVPFEAELHNYKQIDKQ